MAWGLRKIVDMSVMAALKHKKYTTQYIIDFKALIYLKAFKMSDFITKTRLYMYRNGPNALLSQKMIFISKLLQLK